MVAYSSYSDFLPKLAAVIAAIPRPVLGGASIVMFGMTAMAGIEELARVRYQGDEQCHHCRHLGKPGRVAHRLAAAFCPRS